MSGFKFSNFMKELTHLELTSDPFIRKHPYREEDVYCAWAEDSDGYEYRILWDIINPDCEDESEACDWTIYTVERL